MSTWLAIIGVNLDHLLGWHSACHVSLLHSHPSPSPFLYTVVFGRSHYVESHLSSGRVCSTSWLLWVVSIYIIYLDFFHPRFVFSPLFVCLFIPTWTYRYLVFTPGHSPVLLDRPKVRSGFSITSYWKIRMNFFANQIFLLVGFLLKSLKLWPLEVFSCFSVSLWHISCPFLRSAIYPKSPDCFS